MIKSEGTKVDGGGIERVLCAVLLNPPLKLAESTISYRNVRAALPLLSCTELIMTNLVHAATKDAPALNRLIISEPTLEEARESMATALTQSHEVLVAWGTGGLTGEVRLALQAQAEWLFQAIARAGHERVWALAGRPRHPSRWRQYVGPEKQRVAGSCFEDRLAKVLLPTRLGSPDGHALFAGAF